MLKVASHDTDCHFVIGQSLLTSLCTFFGSVAFELTQKASPSAQTKPKSWLICIICVIFSLLQAITKEIAAIKN